MNTLVSIRTNIVYAKKKKQDEKAEDEFVRHKILDAIGDMALLEYTMVGEYDAIAGSHHLNHLLTKKLFESAENYEIIDLEEASEQAVVFEMAYANADN